MDSEIRNLERLADIEHDIGGSSLFGQKPSDFKQRKTIGAF